MAIKAVIYARYSSHNQRDESIEGQLRECYDFASKHEMTVVGEYIDRAISGKTDNRPDFQRLIKDSEKQKFNAVIMYTIDRFARNRYDSAIYKSKLKKNGVQLFYAKQPLPDSPEGIILESVLEGYAEYYSENLSRGIKRGLRENALNGIGTGKPCLGYKLDANKQFVIDPVGAEAVKMIYSMYAEGKSYVAITSELNNRGYRTIRGNKFDHNSLQRILRNEKYIGVYRYDDIVHEDCIPPIIEKSLFEQVQEKLHSRKQTKARNKGGEDYILTSKVFCGYCGEPMIGESGTSKTGRLYRYYKCAGRKRKRNCNKSVEKKDKLETRITQFVINTALTDENIDMMATKVIELLEKDFKDNSLLGGLKQSLKDVNTKLNNVMSAIEQGIVTPTTKDRLHELEELKMNIETEIEVEESKKSFLTKDHIVYWLNTFRDGDIKDKEYQRRIIDTLVNSIYVFDDRIIIALNTSGANTYTLTGSDITHLAPPNDIYPNTVFYVKYCTVFVLTVD